MTQPVRSSSCNFVTSVPPATAPVSTPSTASTVFFNPESGVSSLSSDFFTAREEACLLKAFQSYRLSSKLCLIDLLGFDFFQHLQALIPLIPSRENQTALEEELKNFAASFVSLYLRLLRTGLLYFINTSPPLDRFSCSPQKFMQLLETICKKASNQIQGVVSSNPSSTTEKLKRMLFLKNHHKSSLEHLTHLTTLKGILIKVLSSPHWKLLLLDNSLKGFRGHESLDRTDIPNFSCIASEIPGIQDLLRYLVFLKMSLESAEAQGLIAAKSHGLFNQIRSLNSSKNDPFSLDFIREWNRLFHDTLTELTVVDLQFKLFYHEANAGRLTHQEWCQRSGRKAITEKTQEEFVESLRINHCAVTLLYLWEEDVNLLIENHAFCPLFPKQYRSKNETLSHFLSTCGGLINRAISTIKPPVAQESFSQKITGGLALCLHEGARSLYSLFLKPGLLLSYAELLTKNKLLYVQCSEFFQPLYEGFALTEELCKKLPEIQKQTEQRLRDYLRSVPPEEFRKQKSQWIQELKTDITKQLGDLFMLVTFFRDLQIFAEQKTFLTDWDYIIPPELREFFGLINNIETIFSEAELEFQKQAKSVGSIDNQALPVDTTPTVTGVTAEKPVSETVISVEKSPTIESVSVSPAAAPESTTTPSVTAPVGVVAPITTPMTTSAALEAESKRSQYKAIIQRLKLATKRREFVIILKELGFDFARYGKGTHEIWEDDESNQVVLPFHNGRDGLKAGTKHSVIKQITASLDPETS